MFFPEKDRVSGFDSHDLHRKDMTKSEKLKKRVFEQEDFKS